jgi:hypothetical protein
MPVERRDLTGNMFLSIQKENRLNESSTTEELAAESPMSRLGKGVKVPEKVSRLRQKLGLKAKQEPNVGASDPFDHRRGGRYTSTLWVWG